MKKYILIILIFSSCAKEPVEKDEFSQCRELVKLDLSKIDNETGLIEFDIIPDINKGTVISPKDRLWEKGIINYAIQGNRYVFGGVFLGFESDEDKEKIRIALKEFSEATGILFNEFTPDELKYSGLDGIRITRGFASSSSYLGKQGGVQGIKLTSGLEANVIWHEFMHALGINHEFTRKDRDQYVTVNYENIPEKMHRQFEIDENSIDCGSFDIESVMMYGSFNVQQDSTKIEITLLNGEIFNRSKILSQGDIQTTKTLYNNEFNKR
jgi:hypothetical protein